MRVSRTKPSARRILVPLVLAGAAVLGSTVPGCAQPAPRAAGGGGTRPGPVATAGADSIPRASLIAAPDLAKRLQAPATRRPALFQVGFQRLYGTGHIPGSRYAGPGSKPEGIAALRQALQPLPRAQAVVLYCGCCPWQNCPNVRPAFRAARAMGFKDVRVLFIGQDLQTDWGDRGFPLVEGDR